MEIDGMLVELSINHRVTWRGEDGEVYTGRFEDSRCPTFTPFGDVWTLIPDRQPDGDCSSQRVGEQYIISVDPLITWEFSPPDIDAEY